MNTYRIFAGGDFQVSETLKINPPGYYNVR